MAKTDNPNYKTVFVSDLIPYARNSRTHSEVQVNKIASSIKEFGFLNPVLIDKDNGIIAGHGRVMAAQKLGLKEVPVLQIGHLSETQKRAYIIADNRLALDAGWDDEMLRVEIAELEDLGFNLELTGFEVGELESIKLEQTTEDLSGDKNNISSLSERFLISPFSVLNAREGWWQNRKRGWLALGIRSEDGRGGELVGDSEACRKGYAKSYSGQDKLNAIMRGSAKNNDSALDTGTSIFDPVLCELAYTWFAPVGGVVLDPFAGGSVRGIVASKLKRQYIGHELRQEQVTANRQQADDICTDDEMPPVWICGDSRKIDATCKDVDADFIFSCPPYADLEVYSDDPQDISTLGYEDFKKAYFEIIKKACYRLKNDRFACFVVGEVRDNRGNYYDFVGDTVDAFKAAGLNYYNEAILVTSVGSLPIRAGKQFSASRKLGKTHQNILVFIKGDGKKAAQACGDIFIHLQDEDEA